MTENQQVKPWISGPLELLQHAEGHYLGTSDFDKRMALISFDNAIEFAISTYLSLHPEQRGGTTYSREEVSRWSQNYHSKLAFLEKRVAEINAPMQHERDTLIFYHKLRNELYHAGNGVVPDSRHVSGIRQAALWVFAILFDLKADLLLLDRAFPAPEPMTFAELAEEAPDAEMTLLQTFFELRGILPVTLRAMGFLLEDHEEDVASLWHLYMSESRSARPEQARIVRQALQARDHALRGERTGLRADQLSSLVKELAGIVEYLDWYVLSVDFLPVLRERYGKWLRSDLQTLYVKISEGQVFLEKFVLPPADPKTLTSLFPVGELHNLEQLVPMDWEERWLEYREPCFSVRFSAQENADRFVSIMGPLDFALLTDLFTEEGYEEVMSM